MNDALVGDWRGESVVHRYPRSSGMRLGGDGPDIEQFQGRIGRRLEKDQLYAIGKQFVKAIDLAAKKGVPVFLRHV